MAHVLVADDDDKVRGVIVSALRRAGHTVHEARDGREAVERFLAAPADVVLMDLLMPLKDGIEAILELRRVMPSVKVIAMSGGGQIAASDYLAWAQTMGVHHTLEKPFNLRDLLIIIDEVVQT
jgi:CheY-like chemotaxis protein